MRQIRLPPQDWRNHPANGGSAPVYVVGSYSVPMNFTQDAFYAAVNSMLTKNSEVPNKPQIPATSPQFVNDVDGYINQVNQKLLECNLEVVENTNSEPQTRTLCLILKDKYDNHPVTVPASFLVQMADTIYRAVNGEVIGTFLADAAYIEANLGYTNFDHEWDKFDYLKPKTTPVTDVIEDMMETIRGLKK